jgi:threonine dehydrogenase-like Zn-dependent dehydrogenase
MKQVYPRALRLAETGLRIRELVTHRFALKRAVEAFSLNAAYQDGVVKVMIRG